jgi:sulfonate transport system substrate-binding protein
MQKRTASLVPLIAVILGVAVVSCSPPAPPEPTRRVVRVGWQPPWANQGQIVQVMKRTDVSDLLGLEIRLSPFTYGGPMIEAALAGAIDAGFMGPQPAINLISKDARWRIVARVPNYRSAVLVPPGSPIKRLEDLRGKTLATAFGSTTHRHVVQDLLDAGLNPSTGDLKLTSVDQAEHAAVIQAGGDIRWGEIDAIATYDPTVALALEQKKARIIATMIDPGVIVMRKDFIETQGEATRLFLTAYALSYHYYVTHQAEADRWYSEASRLAVRPESFQEMAAVEPSMKATSIAELQLAFTDADGQQIQRAADHAVELKLTAKRPDVIGSLDQQLIRKAQEALAGSKENTRIRPLEPGNVR